MKTAKKVFGAFFIVLSASAFAGPQDEFENVLTKLDTGAKIRVGVNLQMCKDENGQTPSAIFNNGVESQSVYFTPENTVVSKLTAMDVRMITLTLSQKMQGTDPFNEAKPLTILDTTTALTLVEDGLAKLSYTISTQEHPDPHFYQFTCDWENGIKIFDQTPLSLPASRTGERFAFLPMGQQHQAMPKQNQQVQQARTSSRTRLQPWAFLGCCLGRSSK